MTLLVGDAGAGKTALLVRGVTPLLRRRSSDALLSTRRLPVERQRPFSERRSAAEHSAAEIVVYFDAWRTAPLMSLHDHIDAALRAARIDPEWHRESLPDRVESLGSRFGLRFLFIFDRFDVFLGRAVGAAHGSRLLEELVQLLNLPSRVNALFAIRSEAREAFDRFARHVSFVSAEVVQLPHWSAPDRPLGESTREPGDWTGQAGPVVQVPMADKSGWVGLPSQPEPGVAEPRPHTNALPDPGWAPSLAMGPAGLPAWVEPSQPWVESSQPWVESSQPWVESPQAWAKSPEARAEPPQAWTESPQPWTEPPRMASSSTSEPSPPQEEAETARPEPAPAPVRSGPAPRRWPVWAAGAMTCAALAVAVFWLEPPSRPLPSQARTDAAGPLPSQSVRVAIPESVPQPSPLSSPSAPPDERPLLPPPIAVAAVPPIIAPAPPIAAAAVPLPRVGLVVEAAAAGEPRLPGQLADAMKGEVDLQVRVAASAIDLLLEPSGAPQVAIVRYDELLAANAVRGAFKPSFEVVAPLYTEEIQVVARADSPLQFIHQIADARINAGPADSGRALTANALYASMFGKPMPQAPGSSLDAQAALRRLVAGDGVDVVLLVGPQPAPWLAGLPAASRRALKLLRFDADSPAGARALQTYLPATLHTNGDLGGAAPNHSTPTLASLAFLVTTGKLDPAERETIDRFARSFCRSLPTLRREGDGKWRDVQPGLRLDTGWPDSPAAEAASACSQGADGEAIDRRANRRATPTPPNF